MQGIRFVSIHVQRTTTTTILGFGASAAGGGALRCLVRVNKLSHSTSRYCMPGFITRMLGA
eukprot:scaffold529210_cov18-Prasinocladus_malaysianus.AAC.1